jgi:hypothetical protein
MPVAHSKLYEIPCAQDLSYHTPMGHCVSPSPPQGDYTMPEDYNIVLGLDKSINVFYFDLNSFFKLIKSIS